MICVDVICGVVCMDVVCGICAGVCCELWLVLLYLGVVCVMCVMCGICGDMCGVGCMW